MGPLALRVDDSQFGRPLRNLARQLDDKKAMLNIIAEQLFRRARKSIKSGISPGGDRFAPLSLGYALRKQLRHGERPILVAGGDLFKSFRRGVQGNIAFVTSNLPYAARHQFGFRGTESVGAFTRKTKKGSALVAAFTRKASTPARPFLGFNLEDQRQVVRDMEELLRKSFN